MAVLRRLRQLPLVSPYYADIEDLDTGEVRRVRRDDWAQAIATHPASAPMPTRDEWLAVVWEIGVEQS